MKPQTPIFGAFGAALLLTASGPAAAASEEILIENWLRPSSYSALAAEQVFEPDRDDDGPVFDSGAEDGDFNLFDYLNIDGFVGTSSGTALNRSFYYLRVGGQYTSGPLFVFGNFLVSDVSAEIDLELESHLKDRKRNCQNDQFLADLNPEFCRVLDLEEEMTYKFEFDESRLDEIYLTYTVSDQLAITVGQNRLTLGQFAFVSPVHMLLPVNSEQRIGFSKVDMRVPQSLIDVSFYPTERLELQAAFIFENRVDSSLEEYFDGQFREDYFTETFGGDVTQDHANGIDIVPADGYDPTKDAETLFGEETHSLFRLVYRPDWGAVGVTVWDGPLHFVVLDYLQVSCGEARTPSCDASEVTTATALRVDETNELRPMVDTPYDVYPYEVQAAPNLSPADAVAFEVSFNAGNWTLIAEIVQANTQGDLTFQYSVLPNINRPCNMGNVDCGRSVTESLNFLQSLADFNNGRAWFDVSYTLLAIGADGRSADGSWIYNLELFTITTDLGDGDELIDALGETIARSSPEWANQARDPYEDITFPSFHVAKNHTAFGRPATWGFALGFFFQFGGLLSYYNVEVTENISLQVGLEFLERTSENDSADDNSEDYEVSEGMTSGISVALQVRF